MKTVLSKVSKSGRLRNVTPYEEPSFKEGIRVVPRELSPLK